MKSIFSQISKLSLFNHVMRLAVVCVFSFFTVPVVAGGGGSTDNSWSGTASVTVGTVTNTGAGAVYVSNSSSDPGTKQTFEQGINNSNTSATFYLHAVPGEGCTFGGWYTDDSGETLAEDVAEDGKVTFVGTQDNSTFNENYFAKFVKPNFTVTLMRTEGGSFELSHKMKGLDENHKSSAEDDVSVSDFADGGSTIVNLKAKADATYEFLRWKIESNGKTTYNYTNPEAGYEYKVTADATISAEFVSQDAALFALITNNAPDQSYKYLKLSEAIAAAETHSKVVAVYRSGTLHKEKEDATYYNLSTNTYTIPSGVTFLIPGDANYTVQMGDLKESDFDALESNVISYSVISKLEIKDGQDVIVNGNICVYAKVSANQQWLGTPFEYGWLHLGKDSHITINSGAKLSVLGYITGEPDNSSVTIMKEGTVRELMQISDWRGGEAMIGIVNGEHKKAFPFTQYYMQNIETKLVLENGAIEYVSTGADVTLKGIVPVNTTLIIPHNNKNFQNGLFELGDNTRLIKYYSKSDDRQKYEIQAIDESQEGICSWGNVKVYIEGLTVIVQVVKDVNLQSKDYVMAINNNMDITIGKKVKMTVPSDIAFLAGSRCFIEEDAKVVLADNASVFIYDNEEHHVKAESTNGSTSGFAKDYWYNYCGWTNEWLKPVKHRPGGLQFNRADHYIIGKNASGSQVETKLVESDARMVVDGYFEGALYTTAGKAEIVSTGSGRILLKNLEDNKKTYQLLAYDNDGTNGGTPHSIPLNPSATLLNGDGTYSAGGATSEENGRLYTYYRDAPSNVGSSGKWLHEVPAGEIQVTSTGHTIDLTIPESKPLTVTVTPTVSALEINNVQNVVISGGTQFATIDNYTWSDGQLTVPLTFTPTGEHDETTTEILIITFKVTNTTSGVTETKDVSVTLTAKENYQPDFRINESTEEIITLNFGDVYVHPQSVEPQKIQINPVAGNVTDRSNNNGQGYVTWTPTEFPISSPFEVVSSGDYFSGLNVVYRPTTIAETNADGYHTQKFTVKAKYSDGVELEKNIVLQGKPMLIKNPLQFVEDQEIHPNEVIERLFVSTGNGTTVTFKYDGADESDILEIVPSGENYKLQVKAGANIIAKREVIIQASQNANEQTLSGSDEIKVTITPTVQWNWSKLYFGIEYDNAADVIGNAEYEVTYVGNCATIPAANFHQGTDIDPDKRYTVAVGTGDECTATFVVKHEGVDYTFTSEIYADPRILDICLRDGKASRTYEDITIEQTNVKFENGIVFTPTEGSGAAWAMELIGVPDRLEFIPQGEGTLWTIQERVSNTALWVETRGEAPITLAAGETYFTHKLQPSTQQIRIICGKGTEASKIVDLCVYELDASASTNVEKVYLPILEDELGNVIVSEKAIVLNYVSLESDLRLSVVDESDMVIDAISLSGENLVLGQLPATSVEKPYSSELITISSMYPTEGIVYLLVKDQNDQQMLKLPIRLYYYPQSLPIRSAEWIGANAEKYQFYITDHCQNVHFDATTQHLIFSGTSEKRFVTFTFKGGPSYISFETQSEMTLQEWYDYWTLEVTDGVNRTELANNAESEVQPEISTVVRDGNTYYCVRIALPYATTSLTLQSERTGVIEIENIIIDGAPDLDVVQGNYSIENESEVNFTPNTTENPTAQTQTVEVTAINLETVKVSCNNSGFTVKHGEITIAAEPVALTAVECPEALGNYMVGNITFTITWNGINMVDEGVLTFTNASDEVLATIRLLGAKDYILKSNAGTTGLYTGFATHITSHPFLSVDDKYKYARTQVNLSNTFDKNGVALFDYLIVYGETTTKDNTSTIVTTPSTSVGSNAKTPYYIYRKVQNDKGVYDRYQYVFSEPNTNQGHKTILANAQDIDSNPLIPHAKNTSNTNFWEIGKNEHLSVYVTGFSPYSSVGYTKDEEGVWLFRGTETSQLDLYLEDCHIYSRNKTEDGHIFTGKEDLKANIFQGDFAQGSGGVFVFECDKKDGTVSSTAFEVNIHTRGNNVLKSNNGCFYEIYGMRAYQVSSPVQIHLMPFNGEEQALASQTHLTFDDLWPTEEKVEIIDEQPKTTYKTVRTNAFLSLQKQHNNAPSIDMGNDKTVVNFRGGQVELQNAQNVSDKYKTTLAISHRSGIMAAGGIEVQMAYGIGTDNAKGGEVNFYDGTITVIPMEVDALNSQYYLMDPKLTATGDTVKDVNGEVVRTEWTSCLRCPENTYVYGGSICMLRACMSPTSKGGAPTDGERILGKYIYKEALGYEYNTSDKNKPTTSNKNTFEWLVKPVKFPTDVLLFAGLNDYYKNIAQYPNQTYGLESVTPDKNGNLILWLPDGYANVKAEEDRYLVPWKACMTEIKAVLGEAGLLEIAGEVGGNVVFENNEDVDNLLYCHLDQHVYDVISVHTGEGEDAVYTYEAPIKVPDGFKMDGVELLGDYIKQKPSHVGDRLYEVTNEGSYKVNNKVYYIASATADVWMTFTAPFDVEKIWVVETMKESKLSDITLTPEDGDLTKRTKIIKTQAKNNADFAAFFGVAMALGSQQTFEQIFADYLEWARIEDSYTGDPNAYDERGKVELTPYDGTNWADANFYLYHNKGDWTLDWDDEDGLPVYVPQWDYPIKDGRKLLEQGQTYSLLFPYCTGCWEYDSEGYIKERTFWDYWTGKFLIFESTQASVDNPHEMVGSDYVGSTEPVTGEWIYTGIPVDEKIAIVTGNKTLAFMKSPKEHVFEYSPDATEETFYPVDPEGDKIIYPTTALLLANIPADPINNAPARGVKRTGEIIYDDSNNGNQNGTSGGHIPTVGGGNDLFVTSIAGGINVAVAAPQNVRVLSSTGAVIYSGYVTTAVDIQLPTTGIYIVSGENEVQKILY